MYMMRGTECCYISGQLRWCEELNLHSIVSVCKAVYGYNYLLRGRSTDTAHKNSAPSDSCSVLVLQTWTLCLFVMRRSHLHYRFLYKQDIILVQCTCFISSYCVPAKGSVTLEHMVTIDIVR